MNSGGESDTPWAALAIALSIVLMLAIGLKWGGRAMVVFLMVVGAVVGMMAYWGVFNHG